MKRLSILMLLALIACQKPELYKTITISTPVQSGDMTKSADDILSATRPTTAITLTLQSKNVQQRRYTVSTGGSVTVPLDTYTVTGQYSPIADRKIQNNASVFFTPPYSVSDEIEVTKDQDSYTVDVAYDCFAIILDTEVCPTYRTRDYSGAMADLPMKQSGAMMVAYLQGTWTSQPLIIRALPLDEQNQEMQEYKCVNSSSAVQQGFVLVENGKWYSFSPSAAETSSAGIGMNYGGWQQGNQ